MLIKVPGGEPGDYINPAAIVAISAGRGCRAGGSEIMLSGNGAVCFYSKLTSEEILEALRRAGAWERT